METCDLRLLYSHKIIINFKIQEYVINNYSIKYSFTSLSRIYEPRSRNNISDQRAVNHVGLVARYYPRVYCKLVKQSLSEHSKS